MVGGEIKKEGEQKKKERQRSFKCSKSAQVTTTRVVSFT